MVYHSGFLKFEDKYLVQTTSVHLNKQWPIRCWTQTNTELQNRNQLLCLCLLNTLRTSVRCFLTLIKTINQRYWHHVDALTTMSYMYIVREHTDNIHGEDKTHNIRIYYWWCLNNLKLWMVNLSRVLCCHAQFLINY